MLPADPYETLEELGAKAREANMQAKHLMDKYLERAEAAVDEALKSNNQYMAPKRDYDIMSKRLMAARLAGNVQEALADSAECNRASAAMKLARDSALAQSPAWKEAKAMQAGQITTVAANPGTAIDDQKKEITEAIKRKDLVVGMTVDEANRAARKRATAYSSIGGQTVFRWEIKQQIGSHQVVTESHTSITTGNVRTEYANVPDYAVVGYVEGTFIDGKLASFRKVNRPD